jgi:signal transduction histidine kinase
MIPFRSLTALTLAFLLAFLTATVATGYVTYSANRTTIVNLVDERITSASIAIAGGGAKRAEVISRINHFAQQRHTGDLGLVLSDAQGRWIAGNIRVPHALPLGYSTLGPVDGIEGLSEGRALVRPVESDGTTLTTLAETEPFDNYNAARVRIYIFGFGSIVLIVVGGAAFFAALIARRIVAMRRTVEAIIDGDMQRRVPVDGSDSAFDQQARAFNRMLDRISELMSGIANVSNDIAHDLRTPLARLRSKLALLAGKARTPAMREELEGAIAQSDELLAMFTAVLRIAEVDGGDRRAGFAPLDLGKLTAEIGAMMQPVAAEENHDLAVGDCADAPVLGDRQLLSQVLINLIENALRHTPAGSRIELGVAEVGGQAVVTVSDDGPGIPEDQRSRAMRRFGRLDKSRARAGHGLGLALADAVMRLHRGSIALGDAGPGLEVTLTIPKI